MKKKSDYQTTSNDFNPIGDTGIYYHKKLDPEAINSWKKGTKVLIRATSSGKDYLLLFIKDGIKVTKNLPNYEKVKNWGFYSSYKILEGEPSVALAAIPWPAWPPRGDASFQPFG